VQKNNTNIILTNIPRLRELKAFCNLQSINSRSITSIDLKRSHFIKACYSSIASNSSRSFWVNGLIFQSQEKKKAS